MLSTINIYVLAFIASFLLFFCVGDEQYIPLDDNGYIVYCPCMGRFGNQADQFLGALSFAKDLNRTLVLPHWITYPPRKPFTSLQIPFDKWFKVDPLLEYHRVVTMNRFMFEFAPRIWPPGTRTGFCYSFRKGNKCGMKDGNPFGPFWDHFNISFDYHVKHDNLLWGNLDKRSVGKWNSRFPPRKYPVLAFHGAPGLFPSLKHDQYLQKYIHFSDYISKKADKFISDKLGGRNYVGIHLRNDIDIVRVCSDIGGKDGYKSLFSSAQCTGYNQEKELTFEMCSPPKREILFKVRKYLMMANATALFIATDNDPMISFFKKELSNEISIQRRDPLDNADDPIVDLALLFKSDFFIGNCISSFSAFARRQRETRDKPFAFFATENVKFHDEL